MTALMQALELVAAKKLPRDAAVESIASAFGLDKSRVEKMFGAVGKTFFVEESPAPTSANQGV